jgi:hypothetical protein
MRRRVERPAAKRGERRRREADDDLDELRLRAPRFLRRGRRQDSGRRRRRRKEK